MVRIEVIIIFLSLQNVFISSLRMKLLDFEVFHQPFVGKFLKLFGSVNLISKTIKAILILNNSYFDCSHLIHLAITYIQKSFKLKLIFCLTGIYERHCSFTPELTVFCFSSSNQRIEHGRNEKKDGKTI